MSTIHLTIILMAHFLGDFLLQSKSMRKNKKDDAEALFSHIGVYSVVLMVTTWFLEIPEAWWATNILAHICIDYITAPASHACFSIDDNWWGMNIVGFDQLLHIFILIATYNWIV